MSAPTFTCAACKRVRPKSQREQGRNRCRDRASCREAQAEWFAAQSFAIGASLSESEIRWAMSGHGVLLPIPDDPRFPALIAAWPDNSRWQYRSEWLKQFEYLLEQYYPASSARDRSLTARHAAPFWLKDGPNVP